MVKSTIASLRSLTLPFGATNGQRIELDGVTGKIRIYNADGLLLVEISADVYEAFISRYAGMAIYDVDGYLRAVFGSRDPAAYVALALYSAANNETSGGLISVENWSHTFNRMVISPGHQNNKGNLEWTLKSAAEDDSSPAMLQAVGITLAPGTPQPIIDFCGGSIQIGVDYPRVVVNDIWYGIDAGYNNVPTLLGSYGRGVVAATRLTTNDSARAANTNTDMSLTFTADSDRLYTVHVHSRLTVGTAAVTYGVNLRNSTSGTDLNVLQRYPPALVPAGSLTTDLDASCLFIPTVSGSVTLVIKNSATSGGTITLQGAGVNEPRDFWIEDIGAQ